MAGLSLLILSSALLVFANANVVKRENEDGKTGESLTLSNLKCPKGDDTVLDNCLRDILKDLTPVAGSGFVDIGLPSIEPFTVDKFLVDLPLGPVNITLLAKNSILHGLTKYKILKIKTDTTNMRMHFIYEAPKIRLQSNYKLDGKVFFFPLTGSGPANIDIFDLKVAGTIQGKIAKNANGEDVVHVDKMDFSKMTIGNMNMKVKGLFDGNLLLSSVVHYFGNRYGAQVFEVVRPLHEKFISNFVAENVMNPIFDQFPSIVEYLN